MILKVNRTFSTPHSLTTEHNTFAHIEISIFSFTILFVRYSLSFVLLCELISTGVEKSDIQKCTEHCHILSGEDNNGGRGSVSECNYSGCKCCCTEQQNNYDHFI